MTSLYDTNFFEWVSSQQNALESKEPDLLDRFNLIEILKIIKDGAIKTLEWQITLLFSYVEFYENEIENRNKGKRSPKAKEFLIKIENHKEEIKKIQSNYRFPESLLNELVRQVNCFVQTRCLREVKCRDLDETLNKDWSQ